MFLKWRGIQFVFLRVYFCCGGGVYSFCFGGSSFENEMELIKGTFYEVIVVPWVEFLL